MHSFALDFARNCALIMLRIFIFFHEGKTVIMTEFRIENLTIPSAEFNGVSTLPLISEELRLSFMQDVFELHEDDELFVNYGMVDYGFPYKAQDNYTRELKDKEQVTVVLENEYLKATFLPQFGGKLHSLFDKKEQKELLYCK